MSAPPGLALTLVKDHASVLRAVATRLSKNATEAEDLVQDTLERALGALDQFQPGTPGSVACTFLVLGAPVPGLAPAAPNPTPTRRLGLAAETGGLLLTETGAYFLLEYS